MTKILSLFDGSIYAQSVCGHTAWAANRLAATVEVLHVLGRRDLSSSPADLSGNLNVDARDELLLELSALDEQRAKLLQKRGRFILNEAKACLERNGVAQVVTKLRHGDLIETVAETSEATPLIVIGKRGEAADFAKLHLGSNLERLARSTHTPLLVASRAFKSIDRFMVAFDGSPSAQKTVDFVASSALLRGLECHILTIGAETDEARSALSKAAATLRAAGYVVHADIAAGSPDTAIAERTEAAGIDLLAMGAYGHSRIRHLIIGSTTTEMIRSCKIPILMCR